ncbi:phage baseplate protein [candidate division KSB1 bacterium]|nr:phage baseplate protein [candidate division KSB1 bacterium]
MKRLSALDLLKLWEWGQGQTLVRRALALLAAAYPEKTPEELAKLSIGQRNACLLKLHEMTFSPRLLCVATCPGCRERLELSFNVADMRAAPESEAAEEFLLSHEGYYVQFRLPNSQDLIAIVDNGNVQLARNLLFERCLVSASHNGEEQLASQLPENLVSMVIARMAQTDSMGDIQLALCCVECGHQWHETFDVVSFFWTEITAVVQRLLGEVHTLAHAYGWREADILAMSPWRRAFYLQMVRA